MCLCCHCPRHCDFPGLREAISGPLRCRLGTEPLREQLRGRGREPTAEEEELSCYRSLSVKKNSVYIPHSCMGFGCIFSPRLTESSLDFLQKEEEGREGGRTLARSSSIWSDYFWYLEGGSKPADALNFRRGCGPLLGVGLSPHPLAGRGRGVWGGVGCRVLRPDSTWPDSSTPWPAGPSRVTLSQNLGLL